MISTTILPLTRTNRKDRSSKAIIKKLVPIIVFVFLISLDKSWLLNSNIVLVEEEEKHHGRGGGKNLRTKPSGLQDNKEEQEDANHDHDAVLDEEDQGGENKDQAANDNKAEIEHFRVQLKNNKPRAFMGTIEIQPNGTLTIINAPRRGTNFIHGKNVFKNLEVRIEDAIQEYGPFNRSGIFFDIDTRDTPAIPVFETPGISTSTWNCKYVTDNMCCMSGPPLMGIANNPCCECSTPLPLHNNQRQENIERMVDHQDPYEYKDKINKAVWHGMSNGHPDYAQIYSKEFNMTLPYNNGDHPRKRMASFNNHWDNTDLLDSSLKKRDWNCLLKYKYIVSVSGNSYAGLLKPALLSNSCVLRQDSLAREWYEDDLIEWTHYVPVAYDLSDLFEKIRWAKEHDEECEKIAMAGRKFALEHFSSTAVNKYVHSVISNGGLFDSD